MDNVSFTGFNIIFSQNYVCIFYLTSSFLVWIWSFLKGLTKLPSAKTLGACGCHKKYSYRKTTILFVSTVWLILALRLNFHTKNKNALNLTEQSILRGHNAVNSHIFFSFFISPVHWINLVKLSLFVFMLLMKTCQVWKLSKKIIFSAGKHFIFGAKS